MEGGRGRGGGVQLAPVEQSCVTCLHLHQSCKEGQVRWGLWVQRWG